MAVAVELIDTQGFPAVQAPKPAPRQSREHIPTRADTDEKVVTLWLDRKGNLKTRAAYERDWQAFRVAVDISLREITLEDLLEYQEELRNRYAPATEARMISVVRSLFTFASKIGYVPFNVGAALELPDVKDSLAERIIPSSQVFEIFAAVQGRDRLILKLLYYAGLRVSELCGLRWKDCQARDGGAGQLTVFGKGGKTRQVKLPARLWKELEGRRGKLEEPVIASKAGRPLAPSDVWRIVRRAAASAGLEAHVSPHWLRHAHISHSLDRGAPVHVVKETVGHASLETTTRYAHAHPEASSSDYLPE